MSYRLCSKVFTATAALFVATACASDPTSATAPEVVAQFGRGSSPTPTAAAVAGTWTATTPGGTSVSTDSTQWSLYLTQNNEKVEGSLIRIQYIGGQSFSGISAIKRGSVSGRSISLEFARGEGAETATTFGAAVNGDGSSMTGFHSRYSEEITLVRR